MQYEGEPPLKVGFARNLDARITQHRNNHLQRMKVHMVARVPARDANFPSVDRDDIVADERKMLKDLLGIAAPDRMRKEWLDPKNIKEVRKAFTNTHSHFANTLPMKERIYNADRILSK